MLLYVLRRLILLLLTLAFASLVVFGLLEVLPGDAAQTMLGTSATPEAVAALGHKLGLDQPFAARPVDSRPSRSQRAARAALDVDRGRRCAVRRRLRGGAPRPARRRGGDDREPAPPPP